MRRPVKLLAAALPALSALPVDAADLNVRLNGTHQGLFITNLNSFPVGRCGIILNSRYKTTADFDIPANGTADVWWGELMTSNDVRFDPTVERLQRIFISCSRPNTADVSFGPK